MFNMKFSFAWPLEMGKSENRKKNGESPNCKDKLNLSACGELYFTLHVLKGCQCETRYGGLCGELKSNIYIYISIKLG